MASGIRMSFWVTRKRKTDQIALGRHTAASGADSHLRGTTGKGELYAPNRVNFWL